MIVLREISQENMLCVWTVVSGSASKNWKCSL